MIKCFFAAALVLAIYVGLTAYASSQDRLSSLVLRLDAETGCEYVSGGSGITPRMEGFGVNYRHRGCRQ